MGFTKFIYHKVLGWKIKGSFDPEIRKSVIVVAPHTSWHDFYIGALARKIIGAKIHFVAKKELFKWPFGWYFRWMGGAPLDRTPGQNKVEAIAGIFAQRDEFRLAIAPEGTRKKVSQWKTGYYYIALKAGVPIYRVAFDYRNKTVAVSEPFYPTGDIDADRPVIQSFFDGVVGKVPEYS